MKYPWLLLVIWTVVGSCLPGRVVAQVHGPGAELKLDGANGTRLLRGMFGDYGHRPRASIVRETDRLRLALPRGGTLALPQTGVYSHFVLTGACEVRLAYEFLHLTRPTTGYGCGAGLAFDLGEGVGRGVLQRMEVAKGTGGYALQTMLAEANSKTGEQFQMVPSTAKAGWMGLKRVKNELVFLAGDGLAGEVKEIGRLPFPEGTVRAVRLFVDPGGSSTGVDVRFSQIVVRAGEITGGIPQAERPGSGWWWSLLAGLVVAVGALTWWRWCSQK